MNLRQKLTTALMTAVACFLLLPTAAADQVILDDLIVDGSACIGFDCVNGESFGFDTIRLKENNLRIRAMDTSNSASFPTVDWQIEFNATSNGGANKFAVTDLDAGRTPFTIEASAPSHSLYVDDGGRLGLGTSTPVVDVHVKSGNTPTLRLEQDGSNGFTPQTWDVAGNESNFFVRDVTNGSTLPFRIRPGAPTSAIDVAANGDIGVGTSSPDASIHVLGADSAVHVEGDDPVIHVEDTGGLADTNLIVMEGAANPTLAITNSTASATWRIKATNAGAFAWNLQGGGDFLTLSNTGNLTLTGNCSDADGGDGGVDGCDAVFSPSYEIESIEEHAAQMWENSYLPAIGPTPEGKEISFSLQERHFGMLNELEKAHIYIERLNERLREKDAEVDEMASRVARLEVVLEKLADTQ